MSGEWGGITKNIDGKFHIGASWTKIKERIATSEATVVGISNPFSDYYRYAIKLAESVREVLPDARIVIGGPHATSSPESFLTENSPIDVVLRGGKGKLVSLFC